MKPLSTSEVREHFSDIVNLVAYGKQRQILSRRGKELVAIIPIEDLRWLEELEDRADLADARTELDHAKEEGSTPWSKVKKELSL